jgi:hypothetical protein
MPDPPAARRLTNREDAVYRVRQAHLIRFYSHDVSIFEILEMVEIFAIERSIKRSEVNLLVRTFLNLIYILLFYFQKAMLGSQQGEPSHLAARHSFDK